MLSSMFSPHPQFPSPLPITPPPLHRVEKLQSHSCPIPARLWQGARFSLCQQQQQQWVVSPSLPGPMGFLHQHRSGLGVWKPACCCCCPWLNPAPHTVWLEQDRSSSGAPSVLSAARHSSNRGPGRERKCP